VDSDLRLLLGLLAEPERLKVVGALAVHGPAGLLEVAERAGLDPREARKALARLENGGLVTEDDGVWDLHIDVLREAVRAATPARTDDPGEGLDGSTAAVLRSFVRDGRLVSIPVQHSKKRIVLDHVARVFEIGVRYSEREVDAMLRAFHPDYAALRRYLVDEGFLSREHGVYWRTGGSVEL
jgi:hypothetical protein